MRDHCIREVLKKTILSDHLEDSQTKIVEELDLPVSGARIDIAVINGHFHGYEIKGSNDTLQRLPRQLLAYANVFDYLTVVTEIKYYKKVVQLVPDWVSVALCDSNQGVQILKEGFLNQNKKSFFIAKLLWKEELFKILQTKNIKFRKADRNWLLCESVANNFSVEEVSELARMQLKSRVNWR